jgi:uncharacterized protein
MKKFIVITCLLAISSMSFGQQKPVKIVFDITSNDTLTHQAVLRHVTGMAAAYPKSKFEVVIYGGAIDMVLKEKSVVAKGIQSLENNTNVSFVVCAETMKRNKVDKSHLLSGVGVVPDAIIEIVTKQSEGWGYIKEAHH